MGEGEDEGKFIYSFLTMFKEEFSGLRKTQILNSRLINHGYHKRGNL